MISQDLLPRITSYLCVVDRIRLFRWVCINSPQLAKKLLATEFSTIHPSKTMLDQLSDIRLHLLFGLYELLQYHPSSLKEIGLFVDSADDASVDRKFCLMMNASTKTYLLEYTPCGVVKMKTMDRDLTPTHSLRCFPDDEKYWNAVLTILRISSDWTNNSEPFHPLTRNSSHWLEAVVRALDLWKDSSPVCEYVKSYRSDWNWGMSNPRSNRELPEKNWYLALLECLNGSNHIGTDFKGFIEDNYKDMERKDELGLTLLDHFRLRFNSTEIESHFKSQYNIVPSKGCPKPLDPPRRVTEIIPPYFFKVEEASAKIKATQVCNLEGQQIGDMGTADLLNDAIVKNLTYLNLKGNTISVQGVRAISKCRFLGKT